MIWRIVVYLAVFAAEAFTTGMYLEYLFERKGSRLRCFLSFILGYLFLFAITPLDSTLMNVIAFSGVNAIIIRLNYICSLGKILMNVGFLSFMMLSSEALVMLLLTTFVNDFAAYTYRLPVWVALAVMSKLLYFFSVFIVARIFRPKMKEYLEEPGSILLLCGLPPSSVVIVVTLIYICLRIREDTLIEILMLISMVLLLFMNILVLAVYRRMQKLATERTAVQVAFERESAQAEYYSIVKEQYDMQRELIHDIRHHMQTLSDLCENNDSGAILQYTQQMQEDPALTRRVSFSSNPVLNIIVVRYAEQCKGLGINFYCDIREHCIDMLLPRDISIIFHNIFSNAVEAASQSNEKSIELTVFYHSEQAVDVISLWNSCDIPPQERSDGLLETSKQNPSQHGIGLRSVKRVLKNYGGSLILHFEETQNRFFTTILLPK